MENIEKWIDIGAITCIFWATVWWVKACIYIRNAKKIVSACLSDTHNEEFEDNIKKGWRLGSYAVGILIVGIVGLAYFVPLIL